MRETVRRLSHLRLDTGDRVDFLIQDDGSVLLRPATDVRELKALLHRKRTKPLSVAEMNAIIRRRAAEPR